MDTLLIKHLKKFSSRAELELYLDFVGGLFKALDLANEDLRFHFNGTTGSGYILPLTINNRYIVTRTRNGQTPHISTIHAGLDFIQDWEVTSRPSRWAFSQKRHDLAACPPRMMGYPLEVFQEHQSLILEQVKTIALRELQACKSTPMRRCHSPLAYGMAVDLDFREEMLCDLRWS